MKERIFSKWTVSRFLYLIGGTAVIIQSILNQQWFGLAIGGYFAAMGLFAFGCASGSCFDGNCEAAPKQGANIDKKDMKK